MSKEKDPAFLFFSKDWLEGTAEMLPEEKGVYIDLLAHQHQKGNLPTDTKRLAKLSHLSHEEFLPIWANIQAKFRQDGERFTNPKLSKVISERAAKGQRNRIVGLLGSLLKKYSVGEEIHQKIKKAFDYTIFLAFDEREFSDKLSEWFLLCLKSIEDANSIPTSSSLDRGVGEGKKFNQFPKSENFNGLPEINIKQAIQFVSILKKRELSSDEVCGLWEVFKTKNLTGKNFYQDEGKIYSHFIDALKYQTFENGTTKQTSGGNSKQANASVFLEKTKRIINAAGGAGDT